ncbi:MAG TPA: host attachment protein [Kofleriaceae bacterium]
MYRACIAVVDATRGRLFCYHRSADADGVHETLVEADNLENEQRYHRARNQDHADVDFARFVLACLRELGDEHGAERVILCAAPRMLGHLRASSPGILRVDQQVTEVARDFANLTPSELHTHLADQHVLPTLVPHVAQ